MQIHLVHLYPHSMSTYGDTGNCTALQKRLEWRGIDAVLHQVDIGDPIPDQADFYFFGGGQDAAQAGVANDLTQKAERIKHDVAAGIPLLAICGGYQLLGNSYQPFGEAAIAGIGVFPVVTEASSDRMIGDLVITANPNLGLPGDHQTIVGFENHSGKTRLVDSQASPLGTVQHGFGNNGNDHTEGCRMHAAIGCYLHGSLLPKNPHLADWFITQSCKRHEPTFQLSPLADAEEWSAHAVIVGRHA